MNVIVMQCKAHSYNQQYLDCLLFRFPPSVQAFRRKITLLQHQGTISRLLIQTVSLLSCDSLVCQQLCGSRPTWGSVAPRCAPASPTSREEPVLLTEAREHRSWACCGEQRPGMRSGACVLAGREVSQRETRQCISRENG